MLRGWSESLPFASDTQGLAIRSNASAARAGCLTAALSDGPLSHRFAASFFLLEESSLPSPHGRRELLITEGQHGARD
jgi:hypothetical protein